MRKKLKLIQRIVDSSRQQADWKDKVGAVASSHTQVTGMLAGFSATIVVLIVSLGSGQNNPRAAISLGIFAMAFFGYVAAGILFSISVERSGNHQFFLFSMASIVYYFSGILSFSAMYPLILLIQSTALRWGVFIMIVGGLFGGYLAAAIPLYDLLLIKFKYLFGAFVTFGLIGVVLHFLLSSVAQVQSLTILSGLLSTCAGVVVTAFSLVVLTFFLPSLNEDKVYRIGSLSLIALATAILCFTITLAKAGG
jgi:hypothetical protein